MAVNSCHFIGNLTRDPEGRIAASGTAVCNFAIAVNDKRGGKETTEFVNVAAFGKLAEICQQYLAKGKAVYIEGRMQSRKWQDKNGNDRTTVEILSNNMQMLGGMAEGSPHPERPAQGQHGGGNGDCGGGGEPPFNPEDDIPFRCLPHWRENF